MRWNTCSIALFITCWISVGAWAQQDPGPRPGPAAAGGAYPTLNANEQAYFEQAFQRFQEVDAVQGPSSGLGPTFNGNSCVERNMMWCASGLSTGWRDHCDNC